MIKVNQIKTLILLGFASLHLFTAESLSASVSSPQIKCLQVNFDNTIDVSWVIPSDPLNEFVTYNIYSSTNLLGPYVFTAGVSSYLQSSYNHVGADPSQVSIYFYLETIYNDGTGPDTSSTSDTLRTMLLNVGDISDELNLLSWNGPSNPIPSGSYSNYYIYRREQGGSWVLVDSIPNTVNIYTDTIKVCEDSITYRVELPDSSGCVHSSNHHRRLYRDDSAPAAPVIDSVTVDVTNGNISMGWTPDNSGDIGGYYVFYNNSGSWVLTDTVFGIANTFYTDTNYSGDIQSQMFSVSAFDTCLTGNPPSPNESAAEDVAATIFLNLQMNRCSHEITLSWNPYIYWDDGVSTYDIYCSTDGGPFVVIGNNSGSKISFIHGNLVPGSQYCYFIRAKRNSSQHSATSNSKCETMDAPMPPEGLYLASVSVISNNQVELTSWTDTAGEVGEFIFLRRSFNSLNWDTLGSGFDTTSQVFSFADTTAKTSQFAYEYKVIALDDCKNVSAISNVSNTILLKINPNTQGYENQLEWNYYFDWDTLSTGVDAYQIYRRPFSSMNYDIIKSVPFTNQKTKDYIGDDYNETGGFCYYVQAEENGGNPLVSGMISQSNEQCAFHPSNVWVPNIFTPNGDGMNELFKPVLMFVDAQNYEFSIFSRLGRLIFTTNDINTGWDGMASNVEVMNGNYVYKINYRNSWGYPFEKTGVFSLMK